VNAPSVDRHGPAPGRPRGFLAELKRAREFEHRLAGYLASIGDDPALAAAIVDGIEEPAPGWANGSPTAPTYPPAEVLLWMRLGGQLHPNTRLPDGAWHDLVNSGRLGLIRDRTLREVLVGYHNLKARWIEHIETAGQAAAEQYRLARQGVIPPEAAWLAAAEQDLSAVDIRPILASFRARAEVRDALVAMIESHNFRAGAAARLRQQAVELLDLLEHELRSRGVT
jgi:hypothetical protein